MSTRTIKDALLAKAVALPAAGANVNTAGIDLGQVTAFPINEEIDFAVDVPATTALVHTKLITFKVQDSADNLTFADVATLSAQTVAGVSGNGNAATTLKWKLPGITRRYVAVNIAVPADGGTVTSASATARLLV
jgi:hypothetical protein